MKYQRNLSVNKKNILLRVDLNVPKINNKITDITKIISLKETLKDLLSKNNKVFLISHFGRPRGKVDLKLSLRSIAKESEKILKLGKIHFLKNYTNLKIQKKIQKMKFGEMCLFENIRFYKEEEKNSMVFSKMLSKNFDYYINDAFSASHRSHASIVNITKFLPSYSGLLFTKEMITLEKTLKNSNKPNSAIIGGLKISTKILLLENLVRKLDYLIIGGGMANTFLAANGYNLGKSFIEKKYFNNVKKIEMIAKKYMCKIILPIDVITSKKITKSKNAINLVGNIPKNHMVFDIGPRTRKKIKDLLSNVRTVLWNGPLGAFEYKPFDRSTIEIAKHIASIIKLKNLTAIVGGGDTIASLKKLKILHEFTYTSTSGGAFLEWLEGKKLPGIKALKENKFN